MVHIFKKGQNDHTLLLLHGTGGNEHDLLSIGNLIDPQANILSIRGAVLEYGMPRFYKRKSMTVFDYESLVEETHNLRDFIDDCSRKYKFNRSKVVVVGYSNGANIAASILFHYEKAFKKAILFHPMVPIRDLELADLHQTEIFIGAGHYDQMMPQHEVQELTQMFQSANAIVEVFWTDYGHQLSKEEVLAAKSWYEGNVMYDEV
ncbi:alpha/beta hydrolase [Mariniplasma anaerobium]|uniref:Putative hydrolase MhqD n=1 Tax=Mariniplasma anaerobium TaxID=2735436 RepID=A0A7U9TGP9_9MOLU|nr:dienelactone hydrolase family protein [Mariniplasma anaerobium]BCR35853.1 putative hydrolase MhqD [Mariniplasma anaerobium]